MKILFISVYYPQFLASFYKKNTHFVENFTFEEHRKHILNELFGDCDFYSDGVRQNGHLAEDIIANDNHLQIKWAKENAFSGYNSIDLFSKIPYLQILIKPDWVDKILEAQISKISPDVLYFHDIEYFKPHFLHKLRKKYFVVAQKASPIWRMSSFKAANVVFTSFPHFVNIFKREGINSEYLKLAFGKKVLKVIPKQEHLYNCTFVGGISPHHSRGVRILYDISKKIKLDVFGYGKNTLDKSSSLYKMHHGEVWGKDMYKVLMQSNMTINRHIDIAGKYANNMRLFEATGSGTLLLTDNKINISEFFNVGKEIVVYKNADDLIKKIKYYSSHVNDLRNIAKAGQLRTLKDHNYKIRMKEMLHLLSKYYH